MANTWVLKFPLVDRPDQPILVHVTQKQGLDLDLLATDGEAAYRGKIRERNIAKLKADNFGGTNQQWASTLRYALVSRHSSDIDAEQQASLEVQCSKSGSGSKAVLSVTFRNRIEDITSRIGSIELAFSEDTDDVDLFGWTCQVIDTRDQLDVKSVAGVAESTRLNDTINALQGELAELIEAKNEYEKEILSKFTILLNEKKRRIRNQQRILEAVKVDPKRVEQLQLTMEGEQLHTNSSGRKRKSGKARSHQVDHDDEESEGFDAMEVDVPQPAKGDEEEDGSDQDSPEMATASESENERDLEDATDGDVRSQQRPEPSKKLSPPPPPRALPFKRKQAAEKSEISSKQAEPVQSKDEEQDETASEDDEL